MLNCGLPPFTSFFFLLLVTSWKLKGLRHRVKKHRHVLLILSDFDFSFVVCNRLRYSASEIRRPSPAIKLPRRLSTPRVYSTSHIRFYSDVFNYGKFCVFSARLSSFAVIFFSILAILRNRVL